MFGGTSMSPTAIFIIIGLVGIIIVLMFAIASGAGNGTLASPIRLTNQAGCEKEVPKPARYKAVNKKSSYKLSNLLPAGPCPIGYTTFTDPMGMSLCCASTNIDVFSRTCAATGAESVCAMSPGISDTRNLSGDETHYPVCQQIAKQQIQAQSGKLCPKNFPNYANSGGGGGGRYKCCAGPLAPGDTDCISGGSCAGLSAGQTIFNTPTSCETERVVEKIQCPVGTNLVRTMKGSSARTRDITIPVCVGVQGNCLSRNVLDKLRQAGYFVDIDPEKNIINCEVYDKIYNERLWLESQAENVRSVDL